VCATQPHVALKGGRLSNTLLFKHKIIALIRDIGFERNEFQKVITMLSTGYIILLEYHIPMSPQITLKHSY